jgi:site-specific DNA recombinase
MKSVSQTPKRAALYTRVSSKEQVSGFSLRQQLDALTQYCEENGIEIIGTFEDPGESGAALVRPGLDALRDRVAEGRVDLVLAQDLDRISREPWHFEYLKSWFADHGSELHTLDDSGDGTPMGEFVSYIRRGVAKLEREDIRRRMTRGRIQRAREGNVIGTGSPPFGFRYNAEGTNYVVDEAAMSLVRRVFALFAEEHSVRAVKHSLEKEGVPSPSGSTRWSRQTLRNMILSDAYKSHTLADFEILARKGQITQKMLSSLDPDKTYGVWWYNVYKRDRQRKQITRNEESEHIAVPIPDAGLDDGIGERARRSIANNTRSVNAGHRDFWELVGVARCVCGAPLGAWPVKRKSGKYAYYYICTKRRNRHGTCSEARYHRAEVLERRIREFTRSLLRKPEIISEEVNAYVTSERAKRPHDPRKEEAALRTQLEKIETRRDRYLEQHALELITTETLKAKVADLDKQRQGVEAELGILKDRESHLTNLEKMAHDFVLDLPDLLRDLGDEETAAKLYQETYRHLNYRATVHADGRIDLYFGAEGEAHFTVSDLPVPSSPPPPDDPVWDTWREGDPIPEPTGEDVLNIGTDVQPSNHPTGRADEYCQYVDGYIVCENQVRQK